MTIVVLRDQDAIEHLVLSAVGNRDVALNLGRDILRICFCEHRGMNGECHEDPLLDHLKRDLPHIHGVRP